MGGLDILVSNAGVTRDTLMMMMKPDMWDEVIKVNLTAYFRLAKASLTRHDQTALWSDYWRHLSRWRHRAMPARQTTPRLRPGMIGMSKSLAQEIASRNVTVNCIAPGFIETAMTDALNEQQRAGNSGENSLQAPWVQLTILPPQRCFWPQKGRKYITGQTIHVNGGMVMI